MEIRIGSTVFSDWKIVREIGRGASGTVYEICKENQGAALTAALKVLRIPEEPGVVNALLSDGLDERSATNYLQKIVDDLIEEIKIMISLKAFAHVVKCEDFLVERSPDGSYWTVAIRMELLESISEYRKAHDLTEADVHRLALHLTKALVLLEERNIIHRDIKPENIFINSYGDFKIGDFGIARVCDQTTAYLSQKGTQSYMAPEVFHGQEYDHTVDIYSLGLVLYKYLNKNRLPFLPTEGAFSPIDRQSALAERLSGKKELPAPVCGSEEFGRIVLKMCANRPEERYPNAKLLMRDLEALHPSPEVVLAADGPEVKREKVLQMEEENLTSGSAPRPEKLAAEGIALGAGAEAPRSQSAFSESSSSSKISAPGAAEERESLGSATSGSSRKGREYAPRSVEESGGKDGKKKGTGGKKGFILGAAVFAILMAALVPAYLSREYALVVEGGSGSGSYKAGTVVPIEADSITGKSFERWEAEGIKLDAQEASSSEIALSMPRRKAQLRAVYTDAEYAVEIESGNGSGEYKYAAAVTAIAEEPAPGYMFTGWEVRKGNIETADLSAREITFAMPDEDVKLAAKYEPMTFRLKVDGAEGSGEYTFGSEVLLTAKEQESSSFAGWEIEYGELPLTEEELKDAELSFAMPAVDVSLRATYKVHEHRVTIRGGTGTGTYAVGDAVEIAAEDPAPGMAFSRWRALKGKPSLEDSSLEVTSFPMPDREVEVEAQYVALNFKLTVDGTEGTGEYAYGQTVVLTAGEKTGQTFAGWEVVKGPLELGDEVKGLREIEFSMPAGDVRIAAVYAQNSHVATINSGSGSGTYEVGETVEIAANPAEAGMRFHGWAVIKGKPNLEDSSLEVTSFPMPDREVEVEAQYVALNFKLTVDSAEGTGEYAYGQTVVLTAGDKTGQTFAGWELVKGPLELGDEVKGLREIEFSMPAGDVRIAAVYVKNSHVATINSGSGSGTYEVGETVEIAANPAEAGMRFCGWAVIKGKPSLENAALEVTSFSMPDQDVIVKCQYEPIEYKLVVNSGSGGGSYHLGDRVAISADLEKNGLRFDGWTVDEGNVSFSDASAQNLTFSMPAEDVVISAHYAAQKRILKVKNGKGSGMFSVGEEVVATAEAYGIEGMTFAYWTVDEGELDTSELDLTQPTLRFEMPDSELAITANYALPQVNSGYVLSVNGGSGSGKYEAGETVHVQAVAPNEGLNFVYWMVNGYPGELDVKNPVLEFAMPEHDVILTAFFSN